MSIRSSEHFIFDGRSSEEFGIINVNMQSGMLSEPFASSRTIREHQVRGNDRPYFIGIEKGPLDIVVSFAFLEAYDEEKIREVARWLLLPKYYAPLVFAGSPDRIFYVLCVDSPELIHNGLSQGYLNLRFRCVDAYTYTPVYEEILDLSANPISGTMYTFKNFGDEECRPLLHIRKIGNGDVSIFNHSNGNAEMTFVNLVDNETIKVDCELREVETDIPLTYRYSNLVGDYLTLPVYDNHLLISGKCELKFTYQLKRLQ